MMLRLLLLATGLAAGQPVFSASVAGSDTIPPGVSAGDSRQRSELELGVSHESLSKGLPSWRSIYLEGLHQFGERQVLYGVLRETRRFGLADTEARVGYYHPLGRTWTALVEASTSPTHEVLPHFSVLGQLQKDLAYGWNVQVGLRHNEYTALSTDVANVTAERYWGSFRGAYSLYLGRLDGETAASHVVQFDHYYGDRNSIGVLIAEGREVADRGPTGVLITDVRSFALRGRHWITPRWAISYEAVHHKQGDLYRRQGVRVGLRRAF